MTQAQIDAYIAAAIGQDAIAPTLATPDTPQAQADTLTALTKAADLQNASIKAVFLSGFQSWAGLVLAGKIANTSPPPVPVGLQVLTASNGWAFIVPGQEPVCPMPPIPQVPTIPTGLVITIGSHLGGVWWAALPSTNIPDGTPMPVAAVAQDGTSGLWLWVRAPVGTGWWEKVG